MIAGSNDKLVNRLIGAGFLITDRVINAFRRVDRKNFVWPDTIQYAYLDKPLPIGHSGQTISAPHMVAVMIENMKLKERNKVLEIGAGSGYSAALMSELVKRGSVTTVERSHDIYLFAKKNLLKYINVEVIYNNGLLGYPEGVTKPFYDVIVFAGAVKAIPQVIFKQLKNDGLLMAPIGGEDYQILTIIKNGLKTELETCKFVPISEGLC